METSNAPGATETPAKSGYAPVNGLEMYYEIHGTGQPLVLIHGSFSAIGTSFAKVLPGLAQSHQVIGVELQAHGRTADIDRPLTIPQLADDIAALLGYLGIAQADVLGYSLGAGIGFELALQHPELVRKLVLVSLSYAKDGFHPGLMGSMDQMQPEQLFGSPWHDEYLQIAPRPEDFPTLVEKIKEMDRGLPDWPDEAVRTLAAPTLIVIGDSDIVRPEHAVGMFRLRGGGVIGEMAGLPNSRLAVLPGTSHSVIMNRADWLVPMIDEFLAAPVTAAAQ